MEAYFIHENFKEPLQMTLEEAKQKFKVTGYTEDLSETRKKGGLVHREELDNQPIFEGFCSPMWENGKLRYESYAVYNMLSV